MGGTGCCCAGLQGRAAGAVWATHGGRGRGKLVTVRGNKLRSQDMRGARSGELVMHVANQGHKLRGTTGTWWSWVVGGAVGAVQLHLERVKCASVQVCKYAVCKYASVQVCKYAGMQVCKCASVQVCWYAGMHVCKCEASP